MASQENLNPSPPVAVHMAAQAFFLSPLSNLLTDALLATFRGVRSLAKALRLYQRRRSTIRELNALDDQILEDIGLPRGLINDAAHGHFVPGASAALSAFDGIAITRIQTASKIDIAA